MAKLASPHEQDLVAIGSTVAGMSMAMTKDEREAFLAEVHVGVLSVADPDGGPPVAAPVWYSYDPARGIRFVTGGASVKGRALAAAGRAALCVQSEEAPGYKYVTVDGPVEIEPQVDPSERLAMACRYLGDEMGKLYIESTSSDGSVMVALRPERWHTADFSKASG